MHSSGFFPAIFPAINNSSKLKTWTSEQLDDVALPGYVRWHALRGRRLATCFLEFGRDSYAAQSFSRTLEGEGVLLVWTANLQCISLVLTAQEVIIAMTFPRCMFLTNALQAPAG